MKEQRLIIILSVNRVLTIEDGFTDAIIFLSSFRKAPIKKPQLNKSPQQL